MASVSSSSNFSNFSTLTYGSTKLAKWMSGIVVVMLSIRAVYTHLYKERESTICTIRTHTNCSIEHNANIAFSYCFECIDFSILICFKPVSTVEILLYSDFYSLHPGMHFHLYKQFQSPRHKAKESSWINRHVLLAFWYQ